MKAGFAKIDITPRVGFELSGFGPYLGRRSTFIRDNLWARGMALQSQDTSTVLVSCDIIGITPRTLELARKYFAEQTGWAPQSLMIHCIHTHSGPPADVLNGWGVADVPYIEILPFKIAQAITKPHEQPSHTRSTMEAIETENTQDDTSKTS